MKRRGGAITAGAPPNATGDDFALIDAITADLANDQCLDRAHVFVTGFSMGGYFADHAAVRATDAKELFPSLWLSAQLE